MCIEDCRWMVRRLPPALPGSLPKLRHNASHGDICAHGSMAMWPLLMWNAWPSLLLLSWR